MFHSARALLFKDGITERSHACVIAYLSKEYGQSLGQDHISWIDTYRLERHESFYGLEAPGMDKYESKDALNKAEKFLESIKNIINDGKIVIDGRRLKEAENAEIYGGVCW